MSRQFDIVEALRIIALKNVVNGDAEYHTRFLFRWYSRTFSTPLHEVQNLDIWDILTAYFEEKFEDMSQEEREEQIAALTEDEDEREARLTAEARDRLESDQLIELSKKQNAAKLAASLPKLGMENLQQGVQPIQTVAELGQIPENVQLTFIPEDEFERLLEGGFANQTKTKP